MALTAFRQREGVFYVTVEVESDLSGTVYYHSWLDGDYRGYTTSPSRIFSAATGSFPRVDVLDTNDPNLDLSKNTPTFWPARAR